MAAVLPDVTPARSHRGVLGTFAARASEIGGPDGLEPPDGLDGLDKLDEAQRPTRPTGPAPIPAASTRAAAVRSG